MFVCTKYIFVYIYIFDVFLRFLISMITSSQRKEQQPWLRYVLVKGRILENPKISLDNNKQLSYTEGYLEG